MNTAGLFGGDSSARVHSNRLLLTGRFPGGLYVASGGSVLATNCLFTGNTGSRGGAVLVAPGAGSVEFYDAVVRLMIWLVLYYGILRYSPQPHMFETPNRRPPPPTSFFLHTGSLTTTWPTCRAAAPFLRRRR